MALERNPHANGKPLILRAETACSSHLRTDRRASPQAWFAFANRYTRPMNVHRALLAGLGLLLLAAPVAARDWHVRTDGNDSADGTSATPLASLRRALQLAAPGDVVRVHGGTYFETAPIDANAAATAGMPIVVEPADGSRPVFDASGMAADSNFVRIGGSHYVFRGLEFRNARRTTFSVWGGQDITIEDCWIHHGVRGALYPGNGAVRIRFVGNRVWRNVQVNNPPVEGSGWPSAVNLSDDGDVVAGNRVFENFGEGIGVYGRQHAVRDNVVHDNWSVDIYVSNAELSAIERNTLLSVGTAEFLRFGAAAIGINLANESASDPIRLDAIRVANNLIGGPRRRCLGQWNGYSGVPMHAVEIRANTLACAASDVAWHADAGDHGGSMFAGNLVWQRNPARPVASVAGSTGIGYDHNLWFGGDALPAAVQGAGDVYADPQFANADALDAEGFQPIASSPAVDAAVPASIADDLFGLPRPFGAAPDLGAIEHRPLLLRDGFE